MRIHADPIIMTLVLMSCIGFVAEARGSDSPASPTFLVGDLTVFPVPAFTGNSAGLEWSIHLPAGDDPENYSHFIVQRQANEGDDAVFSLETLSGNMMSSFPLGPLGSEFELWTLRMDPLDAFLLDSTFVSPATPTASVMIYSEDSYFFPRTRADRPFTVEVTVNGLVVEEEQPDWLKSVGLKRYVQSYGDGDGSELDREQATLLPQASLTENGTHDLHFPMHAIPGGNPAKARGEERFVVHLVGGGEMPDYPLDSAFIQIWPMADAQIVGLSEGQVIGPEVPALQMHLNDLYPSSSTFAQIYPGTPQPGMTGRIVPGTSLMVEGPAPVDHVAGVEDYLAIFDSDGVWTMEIITETPFGAERLNMVTFIVQGTVKILEDWRELHFGSPDNSGDGADLNDYDQDGLPNLIEFAFGLDPKNPDRGAMPVPEVVDGGLAISFRQPVGVGGIRYGAEWSPNLQPGSWLPVPNSARQPDYTFAVPATEGGSVFMRLKVTGP